MLSAVISDDLCFQRIELLRLAYFASECVGLVWLFIKLLLGFSLV